MLYSVGNFRTSSTGHSIASNPKRTALRRWGEEPGFTEALQQRAGSLNIKRLLLIKENQISQIKEFSTFLCMGRCKSLGSLKSFPWSAPLLSGAGVLCFLGALHPGDCNATAMAATPFAYWYGRWHSSFTEGKRQGGKGRMMCVSALPTAQEVSRAWEGLG